MDISQCMFNRTLKMHCKLPFTYIYIYIYIYIYTHIHVCVYTSSTNTLILSSFLPTIEQHSHHNQFSKIWKCVEGIWVSLLQTVWKSERCRKHDYGGREFIDGFAQPCTLSWQTALANKTASYGPIPICKPPHSNHLIRCLFTDSLYRYLIVIFHLPHAILRESSIQPTHQ